MRYLVLKPRDPFDPRALRITSLADLHNHIPTVADCDRERDAVTAVRSMYPDAVGMPCPIHVGSGDMWLLGFVEEAWKPINPDAVIPFCVFVQLVAENAMDKATLQRKPAHAFDRQLWKLPIVRPELGASHEVEIRASDLEVPAFVNARVGTYNGRLTIYAEVGGIEMSMTFRDADTKFTGRGTAP